jgi:hypothetical protein
VLTESCRFSLRGRVKNKENVETHNDEESAGRDLEMVERRAEVELRQRKVLWGASWSRTVAQNETSATSYNWGHLMTKAQTFQTAAFPPNCPSPHHQTCLQVQILRKRTAQRIRRNFTRPSMCIRSTILLHHTSPLPDTR